MSKAILEIYIATEIPYKLKNASLTTVTTREHKQTDRQKGRQAEGKNREAKGNKKWSVRE